MRRGGTIGVKEWIEERCLLTLPEAPDWRQSEVIYSLSYAMAHALYYEFPDVFRELEAALLKCDTEKRSEPKQAPLLPPE
jgi:hypothetical protein